MAKGKPLKTLGSGLMSAGGVMQMVPGVGNVIGAITGGLGLGMNILDWALGSGKTDWGKWEKEQTAKIDEIYGKAKRETIDSSYKLSDDLLGLAANKAGMQSGIAGMNAAGTGRVNAGIVSSIIGDRNRTIGNAISAYNQQAAGAKQQIANKASEYAIAEEANAPDTMDYLGNIMDTLATGPGQTFAGAVAGGIGKLFSGKGPIFKTKTPTVGYGVDKSLPLDSSEAINPQDVDLVGDITRNKNYSIPEDNTLPISLPSGTTSMGKFLPMYKFMQSNEWGRKYRQIPGIKPLPKQYIY